MKNPNMDRWFVTHTGRQVRPLNIRPEHICIDDIAHSLSLLCRFSGHCHEFYSVAEHSVLCLRIARILKPDLTRQFARGVLLHDGAEALGFGDMIAPLKQDMVEYRRALCNADIMVFKKFDLLPDREEAQKDLFALIKRADLTALLMERNQLLPPGEPWACLEGVEDLGFKVACLPPKQAWQLFLEAYSEVMP